MSDKVVFNLPDPLRNWPWPRRTNPFYEECKAESQEWCESFKALSPKAQKVFNLGKFALLASLACPLLNKDGCRIACDFMNLGFLIDEHSDVADDETVRVQMACIMDALRDPHKSRPDGEWIGGEITRSFWLNAIRTATPTAQKRIIHAFQVYTDAVVQEATERNAHHVRDIKGYCELRRNSCGSMPSLAISDVHLDLPDMVLEDPAVKELTALGVDIMWITNDIYSYNVEQSRNDGGQNIVSVVMHELGLDIHGALQWIANLHDDLVARFLKAWHNVPVYGGPLDLQVRTYTEGLGNWIRANDQWSFESERYFGKEGMKIQETRKVVLLPKRPHIGL